MMFKIIAFAIFAVGIVLFLMGFHFIDNAWNMQSSCWDTNARGEKFTRLELYNMGLQQMFSALALFFMAFMFSLLSSQTVLYPKLRNN